MAKRVLALTLFLSIDKWYVAPEVSAEDKPAARPKASTSASITGSTTDEEQLLILLGEFGTGKSSFAKRAAKRVLAQGKGKPGKF